VKKQFVMIFVAIVMSMFIIQGAYAEMSTPNDGAVIEPVYVEEDFDIDLEVDEQNVFMLGPGESVEDYASVLGSATSDLVFTPVTPCRIIDTRNAGGIIAANTGRQFQVNMGNYSSQGGYAGSCNIPINPAAVAINVASTQQTGNGHIRVIVTGGGIPLAAMLNYKAGTNISNAAVVRSLETGTYDIFIYSGVSATHVVVDIMGYFAPPVRTAVNNYTVRSQQSVAAGGIFTLASPACPAGYRVTGGGYTQNVWSPNFVNISKPVAGTSSGLISGANVASRWMCQGRNTSGGAQTIYCYAICSQIPGR
jgi:hypothetical protein